MSDIKAALQAEIENMECFCDEIPFGLCEEDEALLGVLRGAAEALVPSDAQIAALTADNRNYSELLQYHIDRQAKAEAQLAELDKQMPIGWMTDVEVDELHSGVAEEAYIYAHADATSTIPLFKRPAPAISLAELVPDVEENEQAFNAGLNALVDCLEDCGDAEQGLRLALRASRAEILRNIEEAK